MIHGSSFIGWLGVLLLQYVPVPFFIWLNEADVHFYLHQFLCTDTVRELRKYVRYFIEEKTDRKVVSKNFKRLDTVAADGKHIVAAEQRAE